MEVRFKTNNFKKYVYAHFFIGFDMKNKFLMIWNDFCKHLVYVWKKKNHLNIISKDYKEINVTDNN